MAQNPNICTETQNVRSPPPLQTAAQRCPENLISRSSGHGRRGAEGLMELLNTIRILFVGDDNVGKSVS